MPVYFRYEIYTNIPHSPVSNVQFTTLYIASPLAQGGYVMPTRGTVGFDLFTKIHNYKEVQIVMPGSLYPREVNGQMIQGKLGFVHTLLSLPKNKPNLEIDIALNREVIIGKGQKGKEVSCAQTIARLSLHKVALLNVGAVLDRDYSLDFRVTGEVDEEERDEVCE